MCRMMPLPARVKRSIASTGCGLRLPLDEAWIKIKQVLTLDDRLAMAARREGFQIRRGYP